MSVEGIKPSPRDDETTTTVYTKVLWANDTSYYDDHGELIKPNDKNITIDFSYQPGSGRLSFTKSRFYVLTQLINWNNNLPTLTVCTQ
jgi:hypothetical protein